MSGKGSSRRPPDPHHVQSCATAGHCYLGGACFRCGALRLPDVLNAMRPRRHVAVVGLTDPADPETQEP
jgi:hypothetical protein